MSLFFDIWKAMEYRKEKGGRIELILSSFVCACLVN